MSNDYFGSIESIKGGIIGNLKDKRQNGFVDCCEEYSFIRMSNNISFNNKMNRLGIVPLVLDEQYDQTYVLFYDLTEPIKYKANTTIGITGYTRSGKSELVETIILMLKEANLKYQNRKVDPYLTFTQPDFYSILKILKRGDILWKDENPRPMGKGSHKETWSVDNILHVIAKMENSFIFVDPKKVRVDCDLYLESAGMNRKTRINRFMIKDDMHHYFGHVYIKLHDNEEFREWYEQEKDAFIEKAKKEGGKFKSVQENEGIEQEEEDETLQEFLEFLEFNYNSRNKDRDLHIWKFYKKGYSYERIMNIVNLELQTIKNICSQINVFLKNSNILES